MKIVAIETIRPRSHPNVLFVAVHSDDGTVGLGEAFFGAEAVESYLHSTAAPVLFAMNDPSPERAASALASYTGYAGAGVETRGNGAVDFALWDLLGKQAGKSLCELFGGPIRDTVPIYNTCAGPGYVSLSSRQRSSNWGLGSADDRPWEDLQAFLTEPARLARELLDEGIPGMKIWPFDLAAEASGGQSIAEADLRQGVAIFEAIRDEVGSDMEVMLELHGLWSRPAAEQIIHAVTPLRPYWVEDPVRPDGIDAMAALRANVDVRIAAGETVVGRRMFLPLLSRAAIDVATADAQWSGGLTEARKVASLADTFGVPVAPHDCTGPVTLACCLHLTQSQPNGLVQETVRAFLRTWYADFTTGLPAPADGRLSVTGAPGHGVALRPELDDERLAVRRRSEAA
ncbi:MAG TPA: mandelate racemase/muconate lactonizing enzyme family protein [Acidimicrobiales bacterium]|nr:mandelate racemase/muconate lactonizing enzyme family protein [Acidimicrobiales bacterium]